MGLNSIHDGFIICNIKDCLNVFWCELVSLKHLKHISICPSLMTYKNAKTILFAGLIAAMILPFSGMSTAEATLVEPTLDVKISDIGTESIGSPVFDGLPTGLKIKWSGTVKHDVQQIESSNAYNICGQNFYMNAFYDTKYNKRGASHQIPSQINGLCNIDADLSGYVNLVLDKVEYRLQGDGNTSIGYNAGASASNYKLWSNGYSNTGNEYVTITAIYMHAP